MKTIQSQNQSEELRKVVETIVQEIKSSDMYEGTLSIERILPPAGTPDNTPAGYPHLAVQNEIQKKFLGLIPYKKKMLCVVKEGFYDIHENGKKEILVLLRSKKAEPIIKKHLEEYGKKNQVTDVIYKT
ncbi:MAG: hypothetical protein ABFD91_16485 [Anaerohalosphaeraceae bacterium]